MDFIPNMIALRKCIKNAPDFFLHHADARVRKAHAQLSIRDRGLNGDLSICRREFDRVFKHVPKHLLQADLIPMHYRLFRGPIDRHLDLLRINAG